MSKRDERNIAKIENAQGGAGYILKDSLMDANQLGDNCKMFAQITLKPGCEVGYHQHVGDTETYYILSGSGIYNDNGIEIRVNAGDVTFCKEGDKHGLLNDGEEDLEMVALILKA